MAPKLGEQVSKFMISALCEPGVASRLVPWLREREALDAFIESLAYTCEDGAIKVEEAWRLC